MLAGWGHVGVNHRGEDDIYVRPFAKLTVLGIIISPLQVVRVGANGDSARHQPAAGVAQLGHRLARQIRQPIQGQIHFAR